MVLAENGSHDVILDTVRSVALLDLKTATAIYLSLALIRQWKSAQSQE